MRLLLATHNEHKRRELERMLASGAEGARLELQTLPDDVRLPPEDGETFAENALGKARAAAAATGRVAIADDSGIEAAALGGAPGVRSARYAGEQATDEENLRKLLREAPAGSALRYVCAIAYVDPRSGVERVFEGCCTGRMAAVPRGAGGFGYDPAFEPDDSSPDGGLSDNRPPGDEALPTLTMAELSHEQKDAISHRGRAARALMRFLTTS
ncbi:MAG TPA: non-canonical purine NTP pyrophosphatase [Solirubrobacteraceae bacterium]